jgi:methionine salvage enolase-phosphatase E1
MLNQFSTLSIADQRSMLKTLRAQYLENVKFAKFVKSEQAELKVKAKLEKQERIAAKRAAAIEKAQARLQKLIEKQSKPVGAKALKANRKPSKVVTYGAEDNEIAAAIMARKATA